MTSTSSTEALVLAHGAFHGPWCWDHLVARLSDEGIRCAAVDLNRGGLAADGDALQGAVDDLIEQGYRVHAMGHSLGCASVATLDTDRLATAILLAGSVASVGGMPSNDELLTPGFMKKLIPQDDGRAFISRDDAFETFYDRCDPASAEWALERLRPTFVYGSEPSDPIFWEAIPVTYVGCAHDRAVAPKYQREVISRMRYATLLDSDHSPMLGAVEPLATAVLDAMARAD